MWQFQKRRLKNQSWNESKTILEEERLDQKFKPRYVDQLKIEVLLTVSL